MRRLLPILLLASGLGSCLAPPPPIVVETPFGMVRASSADKAAEIATLLRRLAPQVRALLPGSQDRPIDVWVQENLRVYRFQERPRSVRGFTLLSGEFDAKRIHLQESGQSPWYLAHELVHALIGPSWHTLPGILLIGFPQRNGGGAGPCGLLSIQICEKGLIPARGNPTFQFAQETPHRCGCVHGVQEMRRLKISAKSIEEGRLHRPYPGTPPQCFQETGQTLALGDGSKKVLMTL